MNTRLLVLLLFASLLSCKSTPVNRAGDHLGREVKAQVNRPETIVYQERDKEILEEILELHKGDTGEAISALMAGVGRFFLETPYVAHTLETEEEEQLIINLRELDCTTFAENCLALSRTIRSGNLSFDQFAGELAFIRYRDGKIQGYPSRLHYFCDWIYTNQEKKLLKQTIEGIEQRSFRKEINFMSTHPGSYRQLKEDTTLVEEIAAQEKLISSRVMLYIPETIVASVENQLKEGDIVGITTSIDGIAIQHVGILVRVEGRIHLMHASSKAEKVVISETPLQDYLLNNHTATGIMLARPV
jgi:hypothetical protein